MELLRALAALAEPPVPELQGLATELELGELPSAAEHTELFLFQLVPYASIYLDQSGRLGGEARDRVAGLWRALGHQPPDEVDHLTTLLSTYATWAGAAQDARSRGEAGALRHRARALLGEHLLSWLGPYLGRVRDLGGPFYRRWAELLAALLAREADRLEIPPEASQHHRATTPLDPEEVASELERSLLAPVRSGLILTRRDLARAARELGLATRIGERRFMLETLLGQASREVRRWLENEALRMAQRYRVDPVLAAWQTAWAERAERTAVRLARSRGGSVR